MNTIAALFLAFAPFTANTQGATADISHMADARAEQLAESKVAESGARMSAERAGLLAPAYRGATASTLARATATEPAGG